MAEHQATLFIDDPLFNLRPFGFMTINTLIENIIYIDIYIYIYIGGISCAELPVSNFQYKYSHNLKGTSDRLQIGLALHNTTVKYVVSTLEIHKFQDKY